MFCRLSWEEESNVSTGDDNSPAGTEIVMFSNLIFLALVSQKTVMLSRRRTFPASDVGWK